MIEYHHFITLVDMVLNFMSNNLPRLAIFNLHAYLTGHLCYFFTFSLINLRLNDEAQRSITSTAIELFANTQVVCFYHLVKRIVNIYTWSSDTFILDVFVIDQSQVHFFHASTFKFCNVFICNHSKALAVLTCIGQALLAEVYILL